MNIKIIIAAHKEYRMPQDNIYLPVHVGSSGKDRIVFNSVNSEGSSVVKESVRDDSGDNISAKNPYYCELTGLYWAWKNLDCDYLGLAHYRRHFCTRKNRNIWNCILNDSQAEELCSKYDIILPARRNYYIETLYSHYAHTHDASHLDITGNIIAELFPEYKPAFDHVLKQTGGYMFNMYIMRRDLSDDYCSFLFACLFELEKRTSCEGLTAFEARYFGRVSEILFNVWLYKKLQDDNRIRTKAIKYIYTEPVSIVKKAKAFLLAKFSGKKYEQSF